MSDVELMLRIEIIMSQLEMVESKTIRVNVSCYSDFINHVDVLIAGGKIFYHTNIGLLI